MDCVRLKGSGHASEDNGRSWRAEAQIARRELGPQMLDRDQRDLGPAIPAKRNPIRADPGIHIERAARGLVKTVVVSPNAFRNHDCSHHR